MHTLLHTPLQDFFQILRPNIRLLRARRRTATQPTVEGPRYQAYSDLDFMKQYPGLVPSQWVDYLALKGDVVDNVPGVRVCGWWLRGASLSYVYACCVMCLCEHGVHH